MDMKLELIVLPVTDVDRAKKFYEDAGFRLDVDYSAGDAFRVVQLTPPQSECSITIGTGLTPNGRSQVPRRMPGMRRRHRRQRSRGEVRRWLAACRMRRNSCRTGFAAV